MYAFLKSPRGKYRLFYAGLSGLMSASLSGQSLAPEALPPRDLSGYLSVALEDNPQLAAFEYRYEAGLNRIAQSSALPDPMLSVTRFVESVETRTGPQETVVMLSQRLPWFGLNGHRGAVASGEAEALWFAYQSEQLRLARAVATSFFEYGYVEKALALTGESLELLRKLEPIVEEKVRAGGDLNALLRLKVEIGKIDDRLQSLGQERAVQSAGLSQLLGRSEMAVLPWVDWEAPAGIEIDGAVLVRSLEKGHPELQLIERQIESQAAREAVARLASYPDITLGVNYVQIGDPGTGVTDAGRDAWGVTLAVNVPIGFKKYGSARSEALASRRAMERMYEERVNALRAGISASMAKHADATRRLQLYGEDLLGLARQALENSRSSYESGRVSILEVIDSERTLLDLELLYWRAAADAWQERITIQTLTNQPLLGTFQLTQSDE